MSSTDVASPKLEAAFLAELRSVVGRERCLTEPGQLLEIVAGIDERMAYQRLEREGRDDRVEETVESGGLRRALDLMNQGIVKLNRVEIFVLDEADQMLDMGFIHDMKRVIKHLPKKRQTLFFSATMPKAILDLADEILIDPVTC